MTTFILIFAGLMLLVGVLIVINPEWIFGALRSRVDLPGTHVAAVVVRLILGYILIQVAGLSKFPLVIEILGWISIFAAVVLALMGRKNFKRLMSWAINLVKPLGRVAGVAAAAFGAFLIYAFV